MTNLHRVVYRSHRKTSCNEVEIKKILDSSRSNNLTKNITGILLHADRKFIQYLEGEKVDVLALYDSIKEDNRHTSITKLDSSNILKRKFPNWQMGYKDVSSEIKFNTQISASDKEDFEKLLLGNLDFTNDGMRVLQLHFQRV